MSPKGNTYDIGNVIAREIYASVNAIGRRNVNSILDMRKYHVEFDDGEVSEMTANVIK